MLVKGNFHKLSHVDGKIFKTASDDIRGHPSNWDSFQFYGKRPWQIDTTPSQGAWREWHKNGPKSVTHHHLLMRGPAIIRWLRGTWRQTATHVLWHFEIQKEWRIAGDTSSRNSICERRGKRNHVPRRKLPNKTNLSRSLSHKTLKRIRNCSHALNTPTHHILKVHSTLKWSLIKGKNITALSKNCNNRDRILANKGVGGGDDHVTSMLV